MKVSLKLSAMFLALIIFVSCACKKRNCENFKVGSVELKEASKLYMPYATGDTLIYQSTNGQQLIFVNTVVNEPYEICVKLLCKNTTGPFETTPCEYYSTTGIRNVLSNEADSLFIDMAIGVNSYQSESLLFYDFFMINMSKIGHLARGEYVPAVHFDDPVFVLADSEVREPFEEINTITLLGETYTDILQTIDSNHTVYYQKGVGIVVLKIDGMLYKLM